MKKFAFLLTIILGLVLFFTANTSFSQISPAEARKIIQTHPEAHKYITPEGMPTSEGTRLLEIRQQGGTLTSEEVRDGLEKLKQKDQKTILPEETLLPEEATPLEEIKQEVDALKQETAKVFPAGLPIFGQQLFAAGQASFTPPANMPVPANYIIGPDDNIVVQLWGRINEQYALAVQRDGSVQLPHIGVIQVAGLTYKQLQELIEREMETITGVKANVIMGKLRSITIFVVGSVKNPGAHTVSAFDTILSTLIYARGPNLFGTMRNIQLKRNNKTVTTFDLYDLILRGDNSKDVRLMPGDIIFVPQAGTIVAIGGYVRAPAIYELKQDKSLLNALQLAGGIKPAAYAEQIQIKRFLENRERIVLDMSLDELKNEKNPFMLQDGDVVRVFPVVKQDTNVVYLFGNIMRPGKYEFSSGMRISDIVKVEDLKSETYFPYGLIKRYSPPEMLAELVPFNLGEALLKHNMQENIILQTGDEIHIFSGWAFTDKPEVSVAGEVRTPGKLFYKTDMRVRDVIMAAGNLTKNAYLNKGQIIRVNEKKEFTTIYFDVARALENDLQENLLLQDQDKIIIHSIWEVKWQEAASIAGEVKKPHTAILTKSMRISDLIFKAGGLTRDSYLERAELYRTDWRTKKVTLQIFNLSKALADDPDHNIELQDLDRVVIHSIWSTLHKKEVSIAGDIANPGTYEYAQNMTIKNLIFAAGNILESTYMGQAEITSLVIENRKTSRMTRKTINLGKALLGDPTHNVMLRPHDRLHIKRIPNWHETKHVTVTGEFKFPGEYVVKKGERLSSLIERAGGYTDHAHLRGAVFTRERVRASQQVSLDEMALRMEREVMSQAADQMATAITGAEIEAKRVELEQKQKFIDSLRDLKATGRMTIQLAHLRLLKGSDYDIILEEGDSLTIPTANDVVTVVGAVMSHGSFIYAADRTYRNYIEMTGGFSRYADKDNIFILKVDGSAKMVKGSISWNPFQSRWELTAFGEKINMIEPGDTIIVPEEVSRVAWMREIKDLTQVLMQIAVTSAVTIKMF